MPKTKYLFRMVHIDNMDHIVKFGITHIDSVNANKDYKAIGYPTLIDNRKLKELPNGKFLGDYIPFYFSYRTPMLYVIQKHLNKTAIIYCVTTIEKILESGKNFCFTDGHGIEQLSSFFFEDSLGNIENLIDWKTINDRYWNDENDLDKKRRKQSEFLVLGDIDYNCIVGFVVFDENTKQILLEKGITEEMIVVKPNFYF
jgi:hypothetical protein